MNVPMQTRKLSWRLFFSGCYFLGTLLSFPTVRAADYPLQFVPLSQVKVQDAYWSPRLASNRTVTIPHLFKMNDEHDRLNNLRKAARLMDGPYVSRRYNDTDVFKLLEAVGFTLMTQRDAALEKIADEQIAIIAKGQEPDGYLYAARTVDPQHPAPGAGAERWSREGGSHELYNMGHAIEAGVAYWQATGKRPFLDIATKIGDMLCRTFGPDKRHDTSGHEEVELALVKLYGATGEKKYLALAQFFIDQRGQPHTFGDYGDDAPVGFLMYNNRPYRQDDKPIIEQDEAEGHAVRAMYLYSGLTDVAALTGGKSYTKATDQLWNNVVGKKMYITGGVGSTGGTEAFAADYVLPNQAYCESCAAIGNALWNERLFRLHGEGEYLDVMERVVYNGLLSGISLRGDTFFYQNPLQMALARGRRGNGGEGDDTSASTAANNPRQPWFDVACCPANLARFIAQFPGFIYATNKDALYVNFFVGSQVEFALNGNKIVVAQETKYPWDGDVKLTVEPDKEGNFTVNLRLPGWATGKALPSDLYFYQPEPTNAANPEAVRCSVNGKPEKLDVHEGFITLHRTWKKGDVIALHLPMEIRRAAANAQVEADRGRVVIERGPLVYCVEGVDNGGQVLNKDIPTTLPLQAKFQSDLLGGITVIKGHWSDGKDLTAVPYYAWGNRGNNEMSVWLRTTTNEPPHTPSRP
jgi:uncharacterized protein